MGKHYSRTKRKTNPKAIALTEQDVTVIETLLRFTILSTDHLQMLAGGGRDGFRDCRLDQALFWHIAGEIVLHFVDIQVEQPSCTRVALYTK